MKKTQPVAVDEHLGGVIDRKNELGPIRHVVRGKIEAAPQAHLSGRRLGGCGFPGFLVPYPSQQTARGHECKVRRLRRSGRRSTLDEDGAVLHLETTLLRTDDHLRPVVIVGAHGEGVAIVDEAFDDRADGEEAHLERLCRVEVADSAELFVLPAQLHFARGEIHPQMVAAGRRVIRTTENNLRPRVGRSIGERGVQHEITRHGQSLPRGRPIGPRRHLAGESRNNLSHRPLAELARSGRVKLPRHTQMPAPLWFACIGLPGIVADPADEQPPLTVEHRLGHAQVATVIGGEVLRPRAVQFRRPRVFVVAVDDIPIAAEFEDVRAIPRKSHRVGQERLARRPSQQIR